MKLIAIVGQAGSGKDTVAKYIQEMVPGTRVIAFADPMKEFCQEVFDFSEEQLWGPSEMRNAPDLRYPVGMREGYDAQGQVVYEPICLTPRFALQTLGTEWGRACYEYVWVDYTLRRVQKLLTGRIPCKDGSFLITDPVPLVVISDARFTNEVARVKRAGARIWRITGRESALEAALQAGVPGHASEQDQHTREMLEYVDVTITNTGTLEELKLKVKEGLKER